MVAEIGTRVATARPLTNCEPGELTLKDVVRGRVVLVVSLPSWNWNPGDDNNNNRYVGFPGTRPDYVYVARALTSLRYIYVAVITTPSLTFLFCLQRTRFGAA